MNLEHASILMVYANTSRMQSALPCAPTLPEPQRSHRFAATRGAFANALHRLGDAVAPTPAPCNIAVCAGEPAH